MSGSACSSACGFCGRCTAVWDDESPRDEPMQDARTDAERIDRAQRQRNDDIFVGAIRAWFMGKYKAQ